jgi:hypothetical protein
MLGKIEFIVLGVLVCAALAPPGAAGSFPGDGATDVHVHLAALPDGKNGCRISPKRLRSFFFRFLIWHQHLPADRPAEANARYVEQLAATLKNSRYVRRAVVLGMDGVYKADGSLDLDQTDFLISNDYVLSVARRYPGLLLAGVSINPQRKDALRELKRCVQEGAVLVKVLPNVQRFDPANPAYIPFYRALVRARIPLLCHVGYEFSLGGEDQAMGDPRRLRLALEQGVTVIAAHGMSNGLFLPGPYWGTLVEFVRKYPNFYWDASALSLPSRVLMLLKLRRHPEIQKRMVFGTDYPLLCFAYPALLAGKFRGYLELRRIQSPFDRHWRLLQILGVFSSPPNEVIGGPSTAGTARWVPRQHPRGTTPEEHPREMRTRQDSGEGAKMNSVDIEAMRHHVEVLARDFVPRDYEHLANMNRAADYIRQALSRAGGRVTEQSFEITEWSPQNKKIRRGPYRNVIAAFGPEEGERVIVGAHYDACGPYPGADDNASGVAGLLELARILGEKPPVLRTDLVGYALEEPPIFATDQMGSAVHARSLSHAKVPLRAMISLEMIGCFRDEKGSQSYPVPLLRAFYPSRGNFIAVVGRTDQIKITGLIKRAMKSAGALPVRSINAPAWLPGIDFSDHRSFWAHGYPAVMITDTASYRNPRYHTPLDTPDTLDYERMAQVVEGVAAAVYKMKAPR